MVECLEKGIILHVIFPDRQDVYKLETTYEVVEVDKGIKRSRKDAEIRKCIKSGEVP